MSKYTFVMEAFSEKNPLKYSSVFKPLNSIINGFRKVIDYSFMKKIMLIGFSFSAFFIVFAASSMFALFQIKEKDFLDLNRDYIIIKNDKNDLSFIDV